MWLSLTSATPPAGARAAILPCIHVLAIVEVLSPAQRPAVMPPHPCPPFAPRPTGELKLRLPPRLNLGTVKAAAWQVLAEAGPEGMRVEDIAREIQKQGLRDLRSSKTPEATGKRTDMARWWCGLGWSGSRVPSSQMMCTWAAGCGTQKARGELAPPSLSAQPNPAPPSPLPLAAVAAALGRDVLFVRTKAATFALQSVIDYHSGRRPRGGADARAGAEGAAPAGEGGAAGAQGAEGAADQEPRSPGGSKMLVVKVEAGQQQEAGHQGEDEEEDEEEVRAGTRARVWGGQA